MPTSPRIAEVRHKRCQQERVERQMRRPQTHHITVVTRVGCVAHQPGSRPRVAERVRARRRLCQIEQGHQPA